MILSWDFCIYSGTHEKAKPLKAKPLQQNGIQTIFK
jgi:hypothetical protein